jgi:hypothetical protein
LQRARHINIAIVQKIMYADWLPILLGDATMKRKGLAVGPGVPRPEYNSFVDPTIPNEFGAAVFRYFLFSSSWQSPRCVVRRVYFANCAVLTSFSVGPYSLVCSAVSSGQMTSLRALYF